MKKCLLLTQIVFVSLLFSCKKESTPPTPTMLELLTSSAWKVTGYTSTAKDTATLSLLKDWNDDLKTNTLFVTYKTNGTYLYSDSSELGTWEISGTSSIIFEKGTPDQLSASLDNLTANNFVITYPWEVNTKVTSNITETAVK